ncbi:MAG TPA: 30S ribosome-binding factor RbfA [Firmicutes bacterium]|nr:30S ribosome-binding factor RbfA [Bacillota bacterium]
MASFKADRLAEDIRHELSAIMRDLKDPRIQGKMLSIVKVDLSNDLSHAKIYISDMKGIDSAKEAVKGLESASGFIRRELLGILRIRKCPELKFIPDDSIEHSAYISKIIESIE